MKIKVLWSACEISGRLVEGPDKNWLVNWLYGSELWRRSPSSEERNDFDATWALIGTEKFSVTLCISDLRKALRVSDSLMEAIRNEFHVPVDGRICDLGWDSVDHSVIGWLQDAERSIEEARASVRTAVDKLKHTRCIPGLGRKEIAKIRQGLEDTLGNLNRQVMKSHIL